MAEMIVVVLMILGAFVAGVVVGKIKYETKGFIDGVNWCTKRVKQHYNLPMD